MLFTIALTLSANETFPTFDELSMNHYCTTNLTFRLYVDDDDDEEEEEEEEE